MNIEERNDKQKAYKQFRASIDMAMGLIYIIIPIYAMNMQFIVAAYGKSLVYTIGGLFIAYGLFRMIRSLMAFREILSISKRKS
ncbi:MAG: hypothetical protein IPI46_03215 [Bacteroidetes bacterium]|nr:hypothetical protein [Bacteroidota bacterium]